MKKKTIKKTFLNIFILSQIFFLILGSTPVASASWASLRYDIDEDDVPAGIKDEGEYEVAATYKRSDQVPKVSVMYSPSNPKPDDEVTATAMAQPFANEEKDLYYTWFLKRKGCGIEGDGSNKFAVSSTEYDPDKDYPSHAEIVNEDSEAASCDADEDGMITVNDWKVEAARIAVPNGFKPDLGGRYSTLDAFYAADEDGDGYQTWQGGADAERMPNHCYGYDATSGVMFEYLNQFLDGVPMCPNPTGGEKIPAICGKDVEAVPVAAPTEDPCYCGADVDDDGNRDVPACYDCEDGYVNPRYSLSNLYPTPPAGPVDGVDYTDGIVQWWECLIDGGTGYYCHVTDDTNFSDPGHMDCEKSDTFEVCEKQSNTPYCGEITSGDQAGQYAALCGSDADGNGIDDDESLGVAICPTNGVYQIGGDDLFFNISEADFNSAISSGLTYQSGEYVFGRDGKYDPYEELPACNCHKTGTMEDPAFEEGDRGPYTGEESDPLCTDRSPDIEDLLCGSLTLSSNAESDVNVEEQYHVFPIRLLDRADGTVSQNYYDKTRVYDEEDDEKFTYIRGNNTGNNSFDILDERYWGTDPRNPSTAGNGKFDEANLAGLGATTFTWTYADGDELGVAVEGTSNVGTKFPDSSRMIMWAFSKGMTATTDSEDNEEVACQPKYSGSYKFEDFDNGVTVGKKVLPDILTMPTGFMDFDRCIEKSTLPVILGGGSKGAQPKNMEVELSATPAKPLNDETGEGKGDVIDIQAVITGSDGTENELSYSWTIKGLAPSVDSEELSVAPSQRDWDDEDSIICDKDSGSCPLRDEGGGKLALSGTGIPELSFRLNIVPEDALYAQVFNENGDGYFKVTMEARESDESSDPPNSRYGYGEVIIKANTSSNRITIFHPTISGNLLSSQGSNFFCTEPGEKSTCQVMKNEIVGLTVLDATIGAGSDHSETLTEFQWYLDGKPINDCDSEMSSECQDGKSTNVTFIPVLGEEGDTFRVSVQAKNISGGNSDSDVQTGKKLNLSQDFKIVQPSLKIVSADEGQVWPKLLGNIVDPTLEDDDANKYTEDYSETVLETASGNNAQLKLEYAPSFLNNLDLPVSWMIDGASATEPSFTAGETGTVHNVSASAVYEQPTEMYRALVDHFGVSSSDLSIDKMSSSIQIEVNEASQAAAFKNPTRFLANLLSKVPSQILFFIRLLLSVAMTIVLVGVIFAFFPETAYDRRRIGQ